jgi:predicted aspartyl protease
MGYTKLKVRITNPRQTAKYRDAELLVDTGAVYTVINGKSLTHVEIETVDKMEFNQQ